MKVVAYSIRNFEKEFIAKANKKKHDITLISNALNLDTAVYAEGKDAVMVFDEHINQAIINMLADLGVKYLIIRYLSIDNIDYQTALSRNIKLSIAPYTSPDTNDALIECLKNNFYSDSIIEN